MTVSTMRSTPPMPSLEDVALQAAAGKEIQDYLAARGVRTAATLALIANDMDHLEKVLIKPLVDGWKVSDTEIIRISSSEAPIAAAVMQHMWSTCRNAWSAQEAGDATLTAPTMTSLRSSCHQERGQSFWRPMSVNSWVAATESSQLMSCWVPKQFWHAFGGSMRRRRCTLPLDWGSCCR